MKKRIAILIAGLTAITMLGGCGMVDSITGAVADKLESVKGGKDEPVIDEDKESGTESKAEQDSADSLALLGDLMGEKYGSASDAASSTQSDTQDDSSVYGDVNAPENQIVVTKAEEWQGFYYGTIKAVGFGDDYNGVNAEFEAYALVKAPEDDFPFMEIYSDEFDIWTNVDFSYDGQALVSMYVDLSDDTLLPVVYKFGDAYVVDVSLTDMEVQAFKTTSDGKTPARIVAKYSYYDPELAKEDKTGGLDLVFDLTKETIY